MAEFDPAGLEARLVELGRSLDLPAPPDLRSAVLVRLAQPSSRRAWAQRFVVQLRLGRRRARRRIAIAVVTALLIIGAITPAGQAAVARIVHAFGVVLQLGSPTAPPRPERLPSQSSASLEQARRQVGFAVVVPAGLGTPDQVSVSDGGRVLSLIYSSGAVSARLDEFDGSVSPVFLKRLSVNAQQETLPGDTWAVWIEGPHDVVYVDAAGTEHTESAHLATHTLIWAVAGVTLRLEGDITREAALSIATASLTPPLSTGPSPPSAPRGPQGSAPPTSPREPG